MNSIIIEGARTHNLKNISLNIPHNKLVVITGLSGSGKSSLAFDTIFALTQLQQDLNQQKIEFCYEDGKRVHLLNEKYLL